MGEVIDKFAGQRNKSRRNGRKGKKNISGSECSAPGIDPFKGCGSVQIAPKTELQMTDHIVGAELALDDIWAVGQSLKEDPKALLDVGRQR